MTAFNVTKKYISHFLNENKAKTIYICDTFYRRKFSKINTYLLKTVKICMGFFFFLISPQSWC
jgi:hypothetical protein